MSKIELVLFVTLLSLVSCKGFVGEGGEEFEGDDQPIVNPCLPAAPSAFAPQVPVPPPDPATCQPPIHNPGGVNGTRGAR